MAQRRFKAQESTVYKGLYNTMKKMEATSLKVERDMFNGGCNIIFDRNGKRYVFRCATFDDAQDNFRAAQLSIEYLYRAIEIYGVEGEEFDTIFNSIFIGIEATPDDSVLMIGNQTEWWEILGINQDATKQEIMNAYRSLAKVHHPDTGGDKEVFIKLRDAYEKAISQQ
ncbi:hypothetical protein LCGC14_2385550 [marine sediment metagenome]|uniref:J domain-containing protein n=1 Tax=marine sediment metagenome TaxID=412755 RepID=A0A0F9BZT1_9ZZZZ